MPAADRRIADRWVSLSAAVVVLVAGVVAVGVRAAGPSEQARRLTSGAVAKLTVHDAAVFHRLASATGFEPGRTGSEVSTGDRVRTDERGFGQVDWFDGSLTRLDVNSELEVTELRSAAPRRVHISLDVGRAWNRIDELDQDESFEAKTAVAVATVRGTIFVVACPVRDTCIILVLVGRVAVKTSSGAELVLRAGQLVTVGPSGEPGPVEDVDLAKVIGADPWLARNADLDNLRFSAEGTVVTPPPTDTPRVTPPTFAGGSRTQPPTRAPTAAPTAAPTPPPTPPPSTGPATPKIAYTSDRGGQLDIWIGEEDGSGARALASHAAKEFGAAISPDGTRVLFTSERDGNQEIYVVGIDGSNLRRLTNDPGADSYPSWTSTAASLVFQSNRTGTYQVYRMNADGTGLLRLTNTTFDDRHAAASPDGRVAFVSNRDGNDEIYVMSIDGSNQRRLTNSSATDLFPAWSPDSSRIAFQCTCVAAKFEIHVMDANGANVVNISNSPGSDEYEPAWSPDGSFIAYSSDISGNADVHIFGADGSNPRNITNNPALDHDPSWGSPG